MFEAKQVDEGEMFGSWLVRDVSGPKVRYLDKNGDVHAWASGSGFVVNYAAILADPTSAYYENRDAALAAIHAHYHDGDTVVLGDGEIRAVLESEECG